MSEAATTIALIGDKEIKFERVLEATPAEVFRAWTTSESVCKWWDPEGRELESAEIDLRPGGRFRFVHESGGREFSGEYREISPPNALVFATPAPTGGETIGDLRFEEVEHGTRLTVHLKAPSAEAREKLVLFRVDKGTARTLDNLASNLSAKNNLHEVRE